MTMEILPPALLGAAAVLLLTSFVKVFTALSVLRLGLGLYGVGFSAVVGAVALASALYLSEPLLSSSISGAAAPSVPTIESKFTPFLRANTDEKVVQKLIALRPEPSAKSASAAEAQPGFAVLTLAFLIDELQEAFRIAVLLLLPFLVVDLLVANILLVVGMQQLAPAAVALPFKLLLFFIVGGWELVMVKLLSGYS